MTAPLLQVREIPFARPWITEEDQRAVLEVLQGPILTHGPQGRSFEEEFAAFLGDGALGVSVSSCMAALHLSYLALGVGPGDEVIVPAQTHVATVHAVEWVGAEPVFSDCDPATGNLTVKGIETALTPRTKAISVVHFVGIPCDMSEIMEVARRYDLKVIEDCALALGSRLQARAMGLWGDCGAFSFYPAKQITTGEGGMFVTRQPELAHKAEKLRAFGVDRSHPQRLLPGMYDVPTLGLNYRMSEIQAALGRTQLKRFGENLRIRRRNFERLKGFLSGLPELRVLDATSAYAQSSHYCLVLVLEGRFRGKREEFLGALKASGIGTSIYYPHPVPRMGYYRRKYGYEAARFPNAEELSDHSIALPVGPHLTEEEVDFIGHRLQTLFD